jgi:hypothetical protein
MLWRRFEASAELDDLRALKAEAIALDQRLTQWQDTRIVEFQPTVVDQVSDNQLDSEIAVGYWPGRIETYFDLYVAGIWNIFRAARVLLIALIVKLSDILTDSDCCLSHNYSASNIVNDMLASVPYHLNDNLQAFVSNMQTSTEITDRGRSLRGLLLLHPLYVASKMPFLDDEKREYLRKCLKWIGSNMGFGRANLLAKVRAQTT